MSNSIVSSHRRVSLTAGILYLLTFVSLPTLALYNSVKGANYVVGSGPDTAAIVGGLLEIIVALAGIGTAVALFSVLKKRSYSSLKERGRVKVVLTWCFGLWWIGRGHA